MNRVIDLKELEEIIDNHFANLSPKTASESNTEIPEETTSTTSETKEETPAEISRKKVEQ